MNWLMVTDLKKLQLTCQIYEAALRGEAHINFEDGYSVNVAQLREDLISITNERDAIKILLNGANEVIQEYEQFEENISKMLKTT